MDHDRTAESFNEHYKETRAILAMPPQLFLLWAIGALDQ
jgi:hypothetical protein